MELKEFIIRSVFPRRCILCNNILPIKYREYLCEKCNKKLEWISGMVCEKCGKPIEYYGRCRSCNSVRHYFDTAYAVYVYKDEIREAIHRFKYKNKGGYAEFFGKEMAKFADLENIPKVDFVVPVPIHKIKQRDRGYNQSGRIADVYCRERDEIRIDLLERTLKTKPQSSLKRAGRIKNIKGAFTYRDCGVSIKGKSILIMDDIYTTGSTVDECAKVLKKAGAGEVYVFCLCISDVD